MYIHVYKYIYINRYKGQRCGGRGVGMEEGGGVPFFFESDMDVTAPSAVGCKGVNEHIVGCLCLHTNKCM